MIKHALVGLALIQTIGCAAVSQDTFVPDQAYDATVAQIHVIRDTGFNAVGCKIQLYIDAVPVATLTANAQTTLSVVPGIHIMSAKYSTKVCPNIILDEVSVNVELGTVRKFRISTQINTGNFGFRETAF